MPRSFARERDPCNHDSCDHDPCDHDPCDHSAARMDLRQRLEVRAHPFARGSTVSGCRPERSITAIESTLLKRLRFPIPNVPASFSPFDYRLGRALGEMLARRIKMSRRPALRAIFDGLTCSLGPKLRLGPHLREALLRTAITDPRTRELEAESRRAGMCSQAGLGNKAKSPHPPRTIL